MKFALVAWHRCIEAREASLIVWTAMVTGSAVSHTPDIVFDTVKQIG
jgi:hypothetical protein